MEHRSSLPSTSRLLLRPVRRGSPGFHRAQRRSEGHGVLPETARSRRRATRSLLEYAMALLPRPGSGYGPSRSPASPTSSASLAFRCRNSRRISRPASRSAGGSPASIGARATPARAAPHSPRLRLPNLGTRSDCVVHGAGQLAVAPGHGTDRNVRIACTTISIIRRPPEGHPLRRHVLYRALSGWPRILATSEPRSPTLTLPDKGEGT